MSWRDHLKIHPAADLFPLMPPEELQALADDIKANGIQVPPELLVIDDEIQLIDGRNRLDAMELAGYTFEPSERPQLAPPKATDPAGDGAYMDWRYNGKGGTKEVDPNELVISLNIHRRHLTTAQKGELIEKLLTADPSRSDRATAKIAQVSHVTVAARRTKLEASGQIDQSPERTGTDGRKTKAVKDKPVTVPETSADPDLGITMQPDAAHLAPADDSKPFYDAIRYMSFEHVLAVLKLWYLDLPDKRQADLEAAVMAWDEDARLTRRRARPTDSMMELTARAG